MPIWGMVPVVVTAAFTVGLLLLVARYVPFDRREPQNDVVGFVYARVNDATEGIPGLLWAALIIGGLVTVGFVFLFGMPSLLARCTVLFCLTLVVGSLLLLIYELNYPFAGAIRVRPDAFELALSQMNRAG